MLSALNLEGTTLDLYDLNRQMDKAKSSVFIGQNSAFLGSIMCSLNFIWSEDLPTAATDGVTLWWNPYWFLKLEPAVRKTVLQHELWHVARLHMIRRGTRDPEYWNYACDVVINNDLERQGNSFVGTDPWKDTNFPDGAVEEDVYDVIINQKMQLPPCPENLDMLDPATKEQELTTINNVVTAVHQAKLAGQAGNLPGAIEKTLKQFLQPVIAWEALLHRFFADLMNEDYTWARPNRRYCDMYLPSRFDDEGKLQKLNYYLDVSGSTSDSDVLRFNSEVKHIKDTYNPREIRLIQFDTRITKEDVIKENDRFDEVKIHGRGGTDLEPVRQHILESKPTAAIIFTDLYCAQMQPLGFDIPIIWVVVNNPSASVPFGEKIHIK